MFNTTRILTALITTLILASCGGGGGGGSSSTPAPAPTAAVTVPLLTAIANSTNNSSSKSFTVSGYYSTTNNTLTGSGTRNVSAATSAVISGVSYLRQSSVTTGTATALNATVLNLNTSGISYANPSTYATVIIDDTNPYVVINPYTYPATVTTGDAGQFATGITYSNSSKTTVTGSVTQNYQVLANTSTSVLVKVITNVYNTSSVQTLQSITTSTIDTSGAITPVTLEQYSYSVGGSTPYYIVETYQ